MNKRTLKYQSNNISLLVEVILSSNMATAVMQNKLTTTDKRKMAKGLISFYDLLVESRYEKKGKKKLEESMKHYFPQVILSTNQEEQIVELEDIAENHLIPSILKYWELALR